jgi:PAS domain S-box-containing protein
MPQKNAISRRTSFLLVVLMVILSACAATAYTLWRLRAEALDRQFDAASLYANAFEDHLTQSFKVIDQSLVNSLPLLSNSAHTPQRLEALLRDAPYLRSIAQLDSQGRLITSTDKRNLGITINRDIFLPPTLTHRPILRAAPPWSGRDFYAGKPATPDQPAAPEAQTFIPVIRDIAKDSSSWATVLAAVNTDYLLNYYARSITHEAGVVELLRYDGIVLLSTNPAVSPGSQQINTPLTLALAQDENGRFEQTEWGRSVLTAYRASRVYPFIVVVHLDKNQGLLGWHQEAWRTVLIVTAVLLAALALAALYFFHSERAARQHDADVEQLRLLGTALEAAANAIMITNKEGEIRWANPAFCALSQYPIDEILGLNPRDLLKSGGQSTEIYRALWETILAGKVWQGELVNRRKDGTCYVEDQVITPMHNQEGEITHFIAVKEDTTERKLGEARMAELSRHLVAVQESARRRLSSDLHDRTSPNLAAIGINLDILQSSLDETLPPSLIERLDDVRALLEDTTASIREICSDLRPPILDYAGLPAALESYVKQFSRRTGIAVQLAVTPTSSTPPIRLSQAVESALFRIAQESLTNAAKHAHAKQIIVTLNLQTEPMALTISDDGIGFDPAALGKTTHTSGLGILTMREMAEFIGGQLTLTASIGEGSQIRVDIQHQKGAT